jgi:16S rRNA (cytosine967-C5)-methyltransferase
MSRATVAVSPARRAAYEVVRRVFEEDAYADRVLPGVTVGFEERDRSLARQLAYGTVQRQRTLDHLIESIGRRKVKRLDAPVRAALRLGAYQLVFLDGVPRYAAVNESVELVRSARLERAVPFTNAVLRRVGEQGPAMLEGLGEATPRDAGLRHSYPDWVAETWWRELGAEGAVALMRAQNRAPESVVRLVRGTVAGTPDPDIPGAWRVDRVDRAAVEEGRIWPQSRGSQLAALCVGASAGDRVLDLCAAPGGKATMLAGDVVAVELHEGRAAQLRDNARLLGAANVTVVCADGRALPPELTGFDRALVDAPCSGLGVLAARPDLRWRAEPLPDLQLELLQAAAARVRPGGTITYSVCTINSEECEEVVARAGLEPEPLGVEWPQFAHPTRPEFLQTLPHVHGTSGFFIARLRARG